MKFEIDMDELEISVAVGYIEGFFNAAKGIDVPDGVLQLAKGIRKQLIARADVKSGDAEPKPKRVTVLTVNPQDLEFALIELRRLVSYIPTRKVFGTMIDSLHGMRARTNEEITIPFNLDPGYLRSILIDAVTRTDPADSKLQMHIHGVVKQLEDQRTDKENDLG